LGIESDKTKKCFFLSHEKNGFAFSSHEKMQRESHALILSTLSLLELFHVSNLNYPFTSKTLTLGANDTIVFTCAPIRFFNKVARRVSKIKALKT
jgi:hypothetical protein